MDIYEDELYHHGILGMKWGVRRYQNYDGTYTKAGLARYNDAVSSGNKKDIRDAKKNLKKAYEYDEALKKYSKDGGQTVDEEAYEKDYTKKWATSTARSAIGTIVSAKTAKNTGVALSLINRKSGQSVNDLLSQKATQAAIVNGAAMVAAVAATAATDIAAWKAGEARKRILAGPDDDMLNTLQKYDSKSYEKQKSAVDNSRATKAAKENATQTLMEVEKKMYYDDGAFKDWSRDQWILADTYDTKTYNQKRKEMNKKANDLADQVANRMREAGVDEKYIDKDTIISDIWNIA